MPDMIAVADLKRNDFIMNNFGGTLRIIDVSPALDYNDSINNERLKIAVYGECGSAGSCRHAYVMDEVFVPNSMMKKASDPKWE